jgi:hypothetical protein
MPIGDGEESEVWREDVIWINLGEVHRVKKFGRPATEEPWHFLSATPATKRKPTICLNNMSDFS